VCAKTTERLRPFRFCKCRVTMTSPTLFGVVYYLGNEYERLRM
jgi:hypothetical protein